MVDSNLRQRQYERQNMQNTSVEEALQKFMAQPGPETAFGLIVSCRGYLNNIAASWRELSLSREEKIRELASEMLLVLLEDFNVGRALHSRSVLAFVHQKLKRLTRPYQARATAFGLAGDLPEIGRTGFTPLRLAFADEIFATVRNFLADYPDANTAQLAFLFVHVFPEVPWASRLLADYEGTEPDRRLEADKKRMASFNQNLRIRFRDLKNGDWRDITEWSGGERSHLAWRIISISPVEIGPENEAELQCLDAWRESIDRRQPQSKQDLLAAMQIFSSLRRQRSADFDSDAQMLAAEEAAPWGDTPDLLLQLVGRPREISGVAAETEEWPDFDTFARRATDIEDPEFKRLAEEVSSWFAELYSAKGKKSGQNSDKVVKYS